MDKTASMQLLTQKNYFGLYYFPDLSGKQAILVCACDNKVESWTGAWVLSHELSHFSLNYYGAPQPISVGWVHYIQYLEYQCQQGNFYKVCPDYSTAVTSPSGHQIPMMEIYGQGSTSYNMPSNPPQSEIMILAQQTSQLQTDIKALNSASTAEFGSLSVAVFTIALLVSFITLSKSRFSFGRGF